MAKILVVDDEKSICLLMCSQLKALGHEAVGVDSAVDGLALLKSDRFQLVMTDILMPEMTGDEFIMAFRGNGNSSLPVIAMSGGGDKGAEQALSNVRELEGASVLMKPFNLGELKEAVEQAL